MNRLKLLEKSSKGLNLNQTKQKIKTCKVVKATQHLMNTRKKLVLNGMKIAKQTLAKEKIVKEKVTEIFTSLSKQIRNHNLFSIWHQYVIKKKQRKEKLKIIAERNEVKHKNLAKKALIAFKRYVNLKNARAKRMLTATKHYKEKIKIKALSIL